MKRILLVLFCGWFCVSSAAGQDVLKQPVYIDMGHVKLGDLLETLEKKYGFSFAYSPNVLPLDSQVSTHYEGQALEVLLQELFSSLKISYKITGDRIVLSKKQVAQTSKTVTGKVISEEDNEALIGVSIVVKGTTKGVSTDVEGNYKISVPSEESVLIFTYLGKLVQEVPVKGKTSINVALKNNSVALEAVVVSGYGIEQKEEEMVGSIEHITSEQLERKPVARIDQMLDGIVPGYKFEVQSDDATSSRPRYQTRIRGEGSFGTSNGASNEPLWIIDGVPVYTGTNTNLIPGVSSSISPLTYINPSDIESVTVLKDATATAIYGANGSNGVVLITTKKGRNGENRINFRYRTGINRVTDTKFQVLNGSEYTELVNEAIKNNPNAPASPFTAAAATNSTDWYKEFFRNGKTSDYSLSFNGGNENTRYFISGGYYKEEQTIIANSTERLSARINLDQRVNKRLDLSFRAGGSYNINALFSPGDYYYTSRPNINPYNEDGTFALYDRSLVVNPGERLPRLINPLAEAAQNDDNQHTLAVNGNLGATLWIIDGLTFTSQNGIDIYNIREDQYSSRQNWSGMDLVTREPVGYSYRAQTSYLKWVSINRFNYDKSFGKHQIGVVAGTEASDGRRTSLSGSGSNFPSDQIKEISFTPTETQRASSSAEEESAFSYLANLNYSWDRRYFLTVNYRRDGNSRFGKDVQWANFSSAGVSWLISNEPFWHNRAINSLKVKASFGTSGNSRIGNYAAKGLYSFGTNYSYNDEPGAIITTGENPHFSWETTYMFNTGVRIGFFDRVYLEAEFYNNLTTDLINEVNISRTTGVTGMLQNVGKMKNYGVEVSISSVNLDLPNLKWTTNFNIAHNKNKILELYNGDDRAVGTSIRRVGEDSRTLYLVRWAGVDPRDGSPLWYDARGNLTRTMNSSTDRVAIGTTNPDFFGGMTNTITYKNFTLNVLLNYTYGGYAFSGLRRNAESDGLNLVSQNQSKNQLDRWQRPGDLATTPKIIWGNEQRGSLNSTRFLHDKTHVRLQNASLNYNIPTVYAQKLKLQRANMYLQVDNIGFWTPYKDSEARNTFKNSFSPFPLESVISLGVELGI